MKHYLYRHVRLDKNEVFYIGIGTKEKRKSSFKTLKSEYKRAYSKQNRSDFWHHIINKASYEIEILWETNSKEEIKLKEKEFVKLYGRANIGQGFLCNLTGGGDGATGRKPTEETRRKMRDNSGLRNKTGELNHLSKTVYVYKITGEFVTKYGSYRDCAKHLNIDKGNISQYLSGKIQQCYGYVFYNNYKGGSITGVIEVNKRIRSVSCYDKNMNLIQNYNSVSIAAKSVKDQTTNISKCCNEYSKTCKGLYWRYNTESAGV